MLRRKEKRAVNLGSLAAAIVTMLIVVAMVKIIGDPWGAYVAAAGISACVIRFVMLVIVNSISLDRLAQSIDGMEHE
jgi:uncharacterized membrane protein